MKFTPETETDRELLCIPVGQLTVPVPEDLTSLIIGPAPWPVTLSVTRVWFGRRNQHWELHFGAIESLPCAHKNDKPDG